MNERGTLLILPILLYIVFGITFKLNFLFSIAALLKKFRIDYKEVFVISELNTKPEKKTMKEFNELIKPYIRNDGNQVEGENVYTSDAELQSCQEKVQYPYVEMLLKILLSFIFLRLIDT